MGMGDACSLALLAYCLLFVSLHSVPIEGSCSSPTLSPNLWEGTIQNANYGIAVYENQQSCAWTVKMSQASVVKIVFVAFLLEPPDGDNCRYDYVEIFSEGEPPTSLSKLCGSDIPEPIVSPGNQVTVHFNSDNSNAFDGFNISYTGLCKGIEVNATGGGTIESPMYPNPPSGLHINCDWKLFTNDGYKIILQYDDYDVYTDGCSTDYLKVYDGQSGSTSTLLSTVCGNSRPNDTSTGSHLFIAYSGGDNAKFKLSYSVERIWPCNEWPYNECLHGGICKDVSYTEFTCTCTSGYTGEMCSEDVNECVSNPCINDAQCINEVNKFRCICNKGYTGVTCNEDINECGSSPCVNDGVCSDVINGFTCDCINGYRGNTCILDPESPFCEAEQDDFDGSYIAWNSADPDEEDTQQCPEGADGLAKRKCEIVSENPLAVEWDDPDLSDCISPEFIAVSKKVEELEESPSEDAMFEVLNELQNITDIEDDSALFPADLVVATDAIATIAATAEETDVDDVDSLLQLFGECVDNVVDPSITSAWKNSNDPDKASQTATSLMGSIETMAETMAKKQIAMKTEGSASGNNSQTTLKLKNLDFNIQVFDNSSGGVFSFGGEDEDDGTASSSITLPKSVLDVDTDTEPEFVAIYTARFKTIGSLLNASSSGTDEQQKYVNGDIVSGKVVGYTDANFQNLKDPVIIVIRHHDDANNGVTCVFLNEDSTTAATQWNTTGCVKNKSNATHTECACDHLTNFAVLMDVHGIQEELAEGHNVALSVLSYIGGTLSIIGCLLSIFIFEFFKLKSDRIRVHQNLAGAMAASLVVFLVGIDRTENVYVCKTFAILLHFLLTSMFMWMLVEGIHLYLALVKVFGTSSHIKKYLILGWGVPLVVIGISVGVYFDNYGSDTVCWLSTEMLLIVFVPTVAIVVILNTAVLVIVVRVMLHSLSAKDKIKGNSQDQETSAIKTSLKAALVLLPLLGLTWVFGFLSVNEYTIIFTYLFAICNSLQGVIFFLFHCLWNIEVKKAYERRYRKSMAATSSMSTTTSSRVIHQQSKRRPSAGTDLPKRRTSITSQESYAYDNPIADTNFDGKAVKRNNEENELKKKKVPTATLR